MANEEQLAILKQGVEVWNRWREEKYNVNIYLYEANLVGADLRRANLQSAYLILAKPRRANLLEADLRGANLIGSNLALSRLSGWKNSCKLPIHANEQIAHGQHQRQRSAYFMAREQIVFSLR
jgi:hypothetical protein